MKIETPQILWHNGVQDEENKPAPILSLSLIESGIASSHKSTFGHVLATAGNSHVNLWKIEFLESQQHGSPALSDDSKNSTKPTKHGGIFQRESTTKIHHMVTLRRHEGTVNTLAFSPNGLHLATAGDTGAVIVWSVPPSKRGNNNGRHFWSTVTQEKDLKVRVIQSLCESIYDLDWSADSKRFMVGSLDHNIAIYEDEHYDSNAIVSDGALETDSVWRCVHRNRRDHTHYIQGVAYDPKGVYIASMSCDRSVRVYQRKPPSRKHKKLFLDGMQRQLQQHLTQSKLDFARGKQIKYRELEAEDEHTKPKKAHLFADENTSLSVFRRLRWTTDGSYLLVPTALWHPNEDASGKPVMGTMMFARHKYDKPCKVFLGHEKPSRVLCPNPILFELPPAQTDHDQNQKRLRPSHRSFFAVLTENAVLIYDTYHTRPLAMAKGLHYSGLTDATWSADGRALFVSSLDGFVSIFRFDEGEMGRIYNPPQQEANIAEAAVEESNETPSGKNLPTTFSSKAVEGKQQGNEVVVPTPTEAKPKKKRISPTLIMSSTKPAAGKDVRKSDSPKEVPHNEEKDAAPEKEKKRISPTPVADLTPGRNQSDLRQQGSKTLASGPALSEPPKKKKKRVTPTLISASN